MRLFSAAAVTAALLIASPAPVLAQGWAELGKDLLKQRIGGTPSEGAAAVSSPSVPSSPLSTAAGLAAGLGAGEIGAGLKEALALAAGRVTDRLGRVDGFNANPALHIPLPGKLDQLRSTLALAGQAGLLDDLEVRLNRAAEAATPEAKRVFLAALDKMTLDDARAILAGPNDAATRYFQRTMTPELKTAMRPVIESALAQAGAVRAYQAVSGAAGSMPLVGAVLSAGPGLLTDHVLDRGLTGIFSGIATEEAAIRADPARRSTDLLKKVFGG